MDSGYQMAASSLRVSNEEREPVLDRLKEAYAEGRLDHSELDTRTHLAMTARTRGELAAVLYDLAPPAALPGAALQGPELTGEDRMLAALAHGSGYVTSFVGPLIFMLLSGKRSEYVRRHAAEAVNFQLTVLLVVIVTFGIGALLYLVTWIVAGLAALAALTGRPFRYPWTIRPVH